MSDYRQTESHPLRRLPTGRPLLGVVTAAAMLGVSVFVALRSMTLGYWTPLGPGPGFFPLCLAVLLGCLSVAWGLRQWRSNESANDDVVAQRPEPPSTGEAADGQATPAPATQPEAEEETNNFKHIAAIVGSLVVLALALEVLGFQLSMLLFLIFHLRIMGRRRWLTTAILSVLGSFGLFVLFTRVLGIFLPASSIPFLASLGL